MAKKVFKTIGVILIIILIFLVFSFIYHKICNKIESKKMQRGFTIVILGRIADALEIDIAELFKPIEKGKE